MRFCFSHPEWRGRREISPCTVFLYLQNHQGAQTCTSAAVEAPEQRNIISPAPWITLESNINEVHINNTNLQTALLFASHFITFQEHSKKKFSHFKITHLFFRTLVIGLEFSHRLLLHTFSTSGLGHPKGSQDKGQRGPNMICL